MKRVAEKNEVIVVIPLVVRIGVVRIEPLFVFVVIHVEHVGNAVPVRNMRCAIHVAFTVPRILSGLYRIRQLYLP